MKRIVPLLLALSVVAAACASAGDDPQGAGAVAPSTTQAESAAPSSPDSSGGTKPEGPEAPDFTLTLASGDSFTLSAEQKPVYMIFWAEW
jgi:cytochrome oxidase Cu insertion factor (SCO1/SenC/PrrC family)